MREPPHVDGHLAILVVARLLKASDDANPDVGMGYPNPHFVEQACRRLDVLSYDLGDEAAIRIASQLTSHLKGL